MHLIYQWLISTHHPNWIIFLPENPRRNFRSPFSSVWIGVRMSLSKSVLLSVRPVGRAPQGATTLQSYPSKRVAIYYSKRCKTISKYMAKKMKCHSQMRWSSISCVVSKDICSHGAVELSHAFIRSGFEETHPVHFWLYSSIVLFVPLFTHALPSWQLLLYCNISCVALCVCIPFVST